MQGNGARDAGDIPFVPDSIEIYCHTNRIEIQMEMSSISCFPPCSASLQRAFLWFLAGESGY
jgi:hypothetical protein